MSSGCSTCVDSQFKGSVYLSGGGNKYHNRRDCRGLIQGQAQAAEEGYAPRTVTIISRAQAEDDGFSDCNVCYR